MEPVPDPAARRGPRDLQEPDWAVRRRAGRQGCARRRLRHGALLRIAAEASPRWWSGIDLSLAVVAARELTAGLDRGRDRPGRPAEASISEPGSFDHIYSIGVLDHTPDPRAAFLRLAALLKPGGRIAIWIYKRERPAVERIMNVHRAVSTRLPWVCSLCLSRWPPRGRAEAKTDGQPASVRRARRGGPASLDDRRLDASRSGGQGLRHTRLVRTSVPFPAYQGGSRRLVHRSWTGRRSRISARARSSSTPVRAMASTSRAEGRSMLFVDFWPSCRATLVHSGLCCSLAHLA